MEKCWVFVLKQMVLVFTAVLKWVNESIRDLLGTADGGTVVKVLCYKSEGHWFDSR
jgi:hypothetical protein